MSKSQMKINGSWTDINAMLIKLDSGWQNPRNVFVKKEGMWKPVYPYENGPGISIASNPQPGVSVTGITPDTSKLLYEVPLPDAFDIWTGNTNLPYTVFISLTTPKTYRLRLSFDVIANFPGSQLIYMGGPHITYPQLLIGSTFNGTLITAQAGDMHIDGLEVDIKSTGHYELIITNTTGLLDTVFEFFIPFYKINYSILKADGIKVRNLKAEFE